MATKYTGGCQCGSVRFELVGPAKQVVACHCTDCQRQSGSAFGMSLRVAEDEFILKQGNLKTVASKTAAGRTKIGAFCPRCGTRIYHKPDRPGVVAIKPGTLDDTRWLKPDLHLWTRSKQSWITIPETVASFETQPS